jgi:chromosome segregation ATPase
VKQDLTRAQQDLTLAQERIEGFETELARREAAAIRHEYDLEARLIELAKVREMFADTRHALAEVEVRAAEVPLLQSELSDTLLQFGSLNSVTSALGADVSELRKQLRLQRASLLEMRDSTSWRLTRPVRVLKQELTRLLSVTKL